MESLDISTNSPKKIDLPRRFRYFIAGFIAGTTMVLTICLLLIGALT